MSGATVSGRQRSVAVTGAGGYVGSRVAGHFRRKGWRVREMRHDVAARDPADADLIPYSLEREPQPDDLRGIEALIHCAYDFRPTRWRDIERINVEGSARLLEAARMAGVARLVQISTMSAFEGCRSLYGRAKLAIEDAAIRCGAVRVRPGLIYGDRPGGTLGALDRAVAASPIVPLVDDGRYLLYLSHEDDLCALLYELCDCPEVDTDAPIVAADDRPRSLRDILKSLATRRARRVTLVPVPRGLILAALRTMESIGLRAGFRSDSLISLVNQNPHPDFGPTRALNVPFRAFQP